MKLLKRILALTTLGILFAMLGCATVQKGGELSEQEIKVLTAQLLDILNKGDLALVDKVYASEFMFEVVDSFISAPIFDSDALKRFVVLMRTSYPDFNVKINETIVKGDRLILRTTFAGTNTGPGQLPPTGKKIKVSTVSIIRVVNGKIDEQLMYYNEAALLRQLGFTFTPP
ncbi:MAG: ester cyclase [Planctomycetota bacterium]|jgi:steroid delta-isomerase-like uncharacterized protein